jgi:hypothetical protein
MSLMFSLVGVTLADSTVTLPAISAGEFEKFAATQPVYSGIQFNLDGTIQKMTSAGAWQGTGYSWLQKGAASSYYIQRTMVEGVLDFLDSGDGVVLSTSRSYALTETRTYNNNRAVITFEISTDAPGTTVKAGPTSYTLNAIYEPND